MGVFKRAVNHFRLKRLAKELSDPDITVIQNALFEIGSIAIEGNDISRTVADLKIILNEKLDEFRKTEGDWGDLYVIYVGRALASHYIRNKEWSELSELMNHEDRWVGFGARRSVDIHFARGVSREQLIGIELASLREYNHQNMKYSIAETLELSDYDKIPEDEKSGIIVDSLMILGKSEYLETRIERMLLDEDYHSALEEIKEITSAVANKGKGTRKEIKARSEALKSLASLTANVKRHTEMSTRDKKEFKVKNCIKRMKRLWDRKTGRKTQYY